MELRELTYQMQQFVTAKGWYSADSKRLQTPRNLAISLSLESAEVLEHFQWNDTDPDQAELSRMNLADVMLYLLQLAEVSGIDLEQAVIDKLKVNYSRTWDQSEQGGGL